MFFRFHEEKTYNFGPDGVHTASNGHQDNEEHPEEEVEDNRVDDAKEENRDVEVLDNDMRKELLR
jgi:hypothetical protein